MNNFYHRNLNSIPTAPMARRCEATCTAVANWGLVGIGDALFILNRVDNHKGSRLGYRKKLQEIR